MQARRDVAGGLIARLGHTSQYHTVASTRWATADRRRPAERGMRRLSLAWLISTDVRRPYGARRDGWREATAAATQWRQGS